MHLLRGKQEMIFQYCQFPSRVLILFGVLSFVGGIHIGPLVEVEAFIPTPPWLYEDQEIHGKSSGHIPVWAHHTFEDFCTYQENLIINTDSCEQVRTFIEPYINDININATVRAVSQHIADEYNPLAIQDKNALLSISSAIQLYEKPKVLVFGSGYDSRMICAAALEGKSKESFVIFVEDNEQWGKAVQEDLDDYLKTRRDREHHNNNHNDEVEDEVGRYGNCFVLGIQFATLRKDWIDYLGKQVQLSEQVLKALHDSLYDFDIQYSDMNLEHMFDVVLVDGPAGANNNNPGRMASISAASRLVSINDGVVFVDDIDRTVERVFSHSVLRPIFQHEVDVRISWRPLRYYTNNSPLIQLLRPREPPTKLIDLPQLQDDVA